MRSGGWRHGGRADRHAPEFAAALPGRAAWRDSTSARRRSASPPATRAGASPPPPRRIRRTKFTADLEALKRFIAKHGIVGLVVGLPLNLDGSDSPRTQSVRAFARNLAPLALPILLWDERWSTVAVERAMIEADMSRAKRAEKVDAHAAAHILQGAIDALVNLPPSG